MRGLTINTTQVKEGEPAWIPTKSIYGGPAGLFKSSSDDFFFFAWKKRRAKMNFFKILKNCYRCFQSSNTTPPPQV